MNDILRVLIVDDEAPARRALQRMLQDLPGIDIVGSAANGLQALDALARTAIDLLLLDIEMPVLAGMELATRLRPAITPAVIFVTAYAHYATRAFEVQAADYLLKPVDPQRLAQALERARVQLRTHDNEQRIAALEASLQAVRTRVSPTDVEHVWVELGSGRLRLALTQVEWFAADGDYVQAHTAERGYLMSDSLGRLESALSHLRFVRIHRSTLVNIDAVTKVTTATSGQLLLTLRSGAELQVGRRVRKTIRDVLGA
jgi:two-component system LytT family response regulator